MILDRYNLWIKFRFKFKFNFKFQLLAFPPSKKLRQRGRCWNGKLCSEGHGEENLLYFP